MTYVTAKLRRKLYLVTVAASQERAETRANEHASPFPRATFTVSAEDAPSDDLASFQDFTRDYRANDRSLARMR